jgi:NAD(P)-dependent dehydrogenase (short-subunit alcohol dehydrogenase family)
MANALIVGAGCGISPAVAHRLARSGYSVALAARRPETLASLAKEIGAHVVACAAAVREDVDQLFACLPGCANVGSNSTSLSPTPVTVSVGRRQAILAGSRTKLV